MNEENQFVPQPDQEEVKVEEGHSLNNLTLSLSVLLVVVLLVGGYFFLTQNTKSNPEDDEVACTADAKICPDGSSVGRVGPNCEFAECPIDEIYTVKLSNLDETDYEALDSFPFFIHLFETGDVLYVKEIQYSDNDITTGDIYENIPFTSKENFKYIEGFSSHPRNKYVVGSNVVYILKDKSDLYGVERGYQIQKLDEVDPKTFEVLSSGYTKDINHVYYREEVLEGANPQTFDAGGYAMDDNNVWMRGIKLIGANPLTFHALDSFHTGGPTSITISTDGQRVYAGAYLLPGVDASSYKLIDFYSIPESVKTTFSEYFRGLLSNCDYRCETYAYSEDKNGMYWIEKTDFVNEDDKIIGEDGEYEVGWIFNLYKIPKDNPGVLEKKEICYRCWIN